MRALIFDTKRYDRDTLTAANNGRHQLHFTEVMLNAETAPLAKGYAAVSIFVNDHADAKALEIMAEGGTALVTLRSTGFNNVDLQSAQRLNMTIMRVANYSPYSVAEHAVALLMTLNRRIHRAYNRTRENNFSLEGLQGHDIHGKTVGLIGTGRIGALFARIMAGFGATLLGYDVAPNPDCLALGMTYVPLNELLARSDVISLHVPLLPSTHHIINRDAVARMKHGVMLINTSRGKLVDTEAVIDGLKSGQLGAVGLDVYEEEDGLFFRDRSDQILADDEFARLVSFPNALVTGHQAFFTHEALNEIAATTIQNLTDFETGTDNQNILKPK